MSVNLYKHTRMKKSGFKKWMNYLRALGNINHAVPHVETICHSSNNKNPPKYLLTPGPPPQLKPGVEIRSWPVRRVLTLWKTRPPFCGFFKDFDQAIRMTMVRMKTSALIKAIRQGDDNGDVCNLDAKYRLRVKILLM